MLEKVVRTVFFSIVIVFISVIQSSAQIHYEVPRNCFFKCADQYQFLTNINGSMEIEGFYQVFSRITSPIKLSSQADIFAEFLKGVHMKLVLLRSKDNVFGGIVVIPVSKSSKNFTPLPFWSTGTPGTFTRLPLSFVSECPSIAAFKAGKTKLIRVFDCYGASIFNYQNIKVAYSFESETQADCWRHLADHKKSNLPSSCLDIKNLTPLLFSIAEDAYPLVDLYKCILGSRCKYNSFPDLVN